LELPIYTTQKISCSVLPENATNTNVIWESSDSTVAVVSQEGDITGIRGGIVDIIANDAEKKVSATVKVTVLADYYSVQYNANGGTGTVPVDLNQYEAGQEVTVTGDPAALTRSGYTVDERGWNTEPDGSGIFYRQDQTLNIGEANLMLYAVWNLSSYTITFDAQGGEATTPSSKTVEYNSPYGELPEPNKSGKTFEGWWTQPDGTGTLITSSTAVTLESDQTLYARWDRPEKVTVTGVDVNGSSVTITWTDPPIGDIDYIKTERYDNSYPQNVSKGTQQVTFSGLSANTPYKFEIETVSTIDGDHSVTETIHIKTTNGTEEHFYPIYTVDQLREVDNYNNLDKNYILMADLNLSNYVTGGGWNPIGTNYNKTAQSFNPYLGIFEGNNHTISDLWISRTDYFQGLFHGLENAEVRNLGLLNVQVGGSASVGALTGRMVNSTVFNCYSRGVVGANDQNIGGLVGYLNSGTISHSYSTSSVSAVNGNVGGLVGENVSGTITHSFYYQTPNNSLGTFVTESAMKQQTTYTGWDFAGETANGTADIWSINPAINDGFPYFTGNAP
jgi:uncharacterized repeat protein (TIGR02543 family)